MRLKPTLLLPARPDIERDAVADAWTARGMPVHRLERFWEPPLDIPREQIRLYGDMTFCLVIAQKLDLKLIAPEDDMIVQLGSEWVRRDIQVASLNDALQRDYPVFIKPLAPKLFHARVYEDADALNKETLGLAPETPVLVSEPVIFANEARCLVLNGSVISAAVYEGNAEIAKIREFAQTFVSAYKMPTTLALDIGWIEGRGWAVVETNAVWGAGLNGCDPDKMVDCLLFATKAESRAEQLS